MGSREGCPAHLSRNVSCEVVAQRRLLVSKAEGFATIGPPFLVPQKGAKDLVDLVKAIEPRLLMRLTPQLPRLFSRIPIFSV